MHTLAKESAARAVVGSHAMRLRRLTPTECERLMGFSDGHTLLAQPRGREAPDGPRYRACGNSMVVSVIRWIGQRIQAQEAKPCDQ